MTASRPGTTSAMTYEIGESTWSIEMSIMDADPRWLAWCLEVGAQEEGRPRSMRNSGLLNDRDGLIAETDRLKLWLPL